MFLLVFDTLMFRYKYEFCFCPLVCPLSPFRLMVFVLNS